MSPQVQTRNLIGTPDELRNALERAHADGRLVSFTAPRPVVHVQAELLPDQPVYGDRSRLNPLVNPRPYLVGAAVLLGGSVVALVVYGVVQLVLAVVHAVQAADQWVSANSGTLEGIALLVVLVLIFGGGAAVKCGGIHCGGCKG